MVKNFYFFKDFDLFVTGLPGAKRWVGGANVQEIDHFNYQRFTTKAKGERAVEDYIAAHSYLGEKNFLPFLQRFYNDQFLQVIRSESVFSDLRTKKKGRMEILRSSPARRDITKRERYFFYRSLNLEALAILTNFYYSAIILNWRAATISRRLSVTVWPSSILTAAGKRRSLEKYFIFGIFLYIFFCSFDDLIVGAPHYFDANPSNPNGGAVFVYFSKGKKQMPSSNDAVFEKPYKLVGPKSSQFGTSIAGVDVTGDGLNGEKIFCF